jgi:hypothetical protein
MLEILSMFNIDPEMLMKVGPIVVLVMGCLSGLYMILDTVSKFTKSDADNKIVAVMAKVMDVMKKIADFFSGNMKH